MRNKKGYKIINTSEYVKEPVDKEVNDILNLEINKIILTGGRGVGKSAVLGVLEKRGLGSDEKTIYMCADPQVIVSTEPIDSFNDAAFEYLYELHFTRNLLFYIKKFYPEIFEKYFTNDKKFADYLLEELYTSINNMGYEDVSINSKYTTKGLSVGVLDKFCAVTNTNKINLAFDRFDWASGSSEYVQKLHERYFDMFNKIIVTSDDETIDKKELEGKGYAIKSISYGSDRKTLAEIIKCRKSLYAGNESYVELFTSNTLLDKLSVFGSNTDLVLDALYRMSDYIHIFDGDVEKALKMAVEDTIKNNRLFQDISPKTKLYL